MTNLEIGQTITFTTSKGSFTGKIEGRNWCFSTLVSYIVRHKGETIPVDAVTFKSQMAI